jgi:von Willebrand factor type C domain/Antistasin family
MNSTWMESNGCMKCWCENGRSRCIAEGCIVPACENPRQIANICCPVCDIDNQIDHSLALIDYSCPTMDHCQLLCEHGRVRDDQGCYLCQCSTITCPMPMCTLKFDSNTSKQFCSCFIMSNSNCSSFNCDKHCPYNYTIDTRNGCPLCACNPCPLLICTKNCTFGLKRNEIGCPLCVCESQSISIVEHNLASWPRQCQSGLFSYSNGEIWFDGCRQCLCYKGQSLCTLISCPMPTCARPIFLPNHCCPSCPGD